MYVALKEHGITRELPFFANSYYLCLPYSTYATTKTNFDYIQAMAEVLFEGRMHE